MLRYRGQRVPCVRPQDPIHILVRSHTTSPEGENTWLVGKPTMLIVNKVIEYLLTGVSTSRAPGKVSELYISFSSSSRRLLPGGKTLRGFGRTFGRVGQPRVRPRRRAPNVAMAVVVTRRVVEGSDGQRALLKEAIKGRARGRATGDLVCW